MSAEAERVALCAYVAGVVYAALRAAEVPSSVVSTDPAVLTLSALGAQFDITITQAPTS